MLAWEKTVRDFRFNICEMMLCLLSRSSIGQVYLHVQNVVGIDHDPALLGPRQIGNKSVIASISFVNRQVFNGHSSVGKVRQKIITL
jgi:serine acetyltransferase